MHLLSRTDEKPAGFFSYLKWIFFASLSGFLFSFFFMSGLSYFYIPEKNNEIKIVKNDLSKNRINNSLASLGNINNENF